MSQPHPTNATSEATPVTCIYIDLDEHPIGDPAYADRCRLALDQHGALVLRGFFTEVAIKEIVEQSAPRESEAYYAGTTHNVYLTDSDPELPPDHPWNRQVVSSKGLLADDQLPSDSPLRAIYGDGSFRSFVAAVVGVDAVYPYADRLSSINVHFAADGMELGWHFDNSSFAVTMLLQAPDGGGSFDYIPAVRDAERGQQAFSEVEAILDGAIPFETLNFAPGDLVLFRGRNAIHRVTPTIGQTTRLLAVLAFNDAPDVALSESALATFYGRTA